MWNRFRQFAKEQVDSLTHRDTITERFERRWDNVQTFFKDVQQAIDQGDDVLVGPIDLQEHLGALRRIMMEDDLSRPQADRTDAGEIIEYMIDKQMIRQLVQYAKPDRPPGILGLTLKHLASTFSCVEYPLLGCHKPVLEPVMELVKSTFKSIKRKIEKEQEGTLPPGQAEAKRIVEGAFVILIVNICIKVQETPEFMEIFFEEAEDKARKFLLVEWLLPFIRSETLLEHHPEDFVAVTVNGQRYLEPSLLGGQRSREEGDLALEGIVVTLAIERALVGTCLKSTTFIETLISSMIDIWNKLPQSTALTAAALETEPAFHRLLRRFAAFDAFLNYGSKEFTSDMLLQLRAAFLNGVVKKSLLDENSPSSAVACAIITAAIITHCVRHDDLVVTFGEVLVADLDVTRVLCSRLVNPRDTVKISSPQEDVAVISATCSLYSAIIMYMPNVFFRALVEPFLRNIDGTQQDFLSMSAPKDDWHSIVYERALSPDILSQHFPIFDISTQREVVLERDALVDAQSLVEMGLIGTAPVNHLVRLGDDCGLPRPFESSSLRDRVILMEQGLRARTPPQYLDAEGGPLYAWEGPFFGALFDRLEMICESPVEMNVVVVILLMRLIALDSPKLSYYLLVGDRSKASDAVRTLPRLLAKLRHNSENRVVAINETYPWKEGGNSPTVEIMESVKPIVYMAAGNIVPGIVPTPIGERDPEVNFCCALVLLVELQRLLIGALSAKRQLFAQRHLQQPKIR